MFVIVEDMTSLLPLKSLQLKKKKSLQFKKIGKVTQQYKTAKQAIYTTAQYLVK